MQTRDIQSDLLLIDRIERPATPFEMRYFTEENPDAVHIATFDGTSYVGCSPLLGGLLQVPITAGTLAEGRILVRRHYATPSGAFPDDSTHDLRYTEKSDIRLRRDAASSADKAYVFEADTWHKHHALAPQTESTPTPDAETRQALDALTARIEQLNV